MDRPARERRLLLVAAAGAATIGTGRAQTAGPVVLGQVSLSFYAVTGAVVHELLEQLGHAVELRTGAHEQMFPLLGQGAIDVMAAAWLPEGHANYWSRYGTAAQEIATLYEGARFFWAVPSYVPADQVGSMADLAKPVVAERMTKLIQGIGSGAGITVRSQQAVVDYGLEPLGYVLRPGTAAQWTGAFDAALAERRWIVFPTWSPQYLNRDGQLRAIADPRGVLGGANRGVLVAPRDRWQALPARTRAVLGRIDLGLDGVTEMDWLVNVHKHTPRAAARQWMQANATRVAAWLAA